MRCRGAIGKALTLHVGDPEYDSRRWKIIFPFFLLFRKTYFLFLTDLKYTGRLIAGSLSAFISKIQ